MSEGRTAATAAHRVGAGAGRVVHAWKLLSRDRRQAALAAIGLFVTLFLPWYQETVIIPGAKPPTQTASLTGWGAFSFVEAAVLLVVAGILTLLFQRAEGKAFHLPGGDGGVITFAGFWTCVLIVWRIFDKQGATVHGPGATASGIEWGIFVALGVAVFLTYSGNRIRVADAPEPPLPGQRSEGWSTAPAPTPSRPAPRPTPSRSAEQPSAPTLQFDDSPPPPRSKSKPPPSEQLTIPLDPGGD